MQMDCMSETMGLPQGDKPRLTSRTIHLLVERWQSPRASWHWLSKDCVHFAMCVCDYVSFQLQRENFKLLVWGWFVWGSKVDIRVIWSDYECGIEGMVVSSTLPHPTPIQMEGPSICSTSQRELFNTNAPLQRIGLNALIIYKYGARKKRSGRVLWMLVVRSILGELERL